MALESFFAPHSVAVVGASHDAQSVGYGLLSSLVHGCVKPGVPGEGKPYGGEIYAVNPHGGEILGVKCHANLADVPAERVDLVIIAVPAKIVPQVMRDAVAKRAKAAIIISAGFGEAGEEGKQLQDEVISIAREGGVRVLGPNCLGLIAPHHNLNASFALSTPPAGNVAFFSQSGAMADSIIDWALRERYTFSAIVSLGNSADVDVNDLLLWALEDDKTSAITIYVEGLKDGRKFMDTLRRVTPHKPVIVLKGGKSAVGLHAVSSHTGSLAGSYKVFAAAVRQAGGLVVNSIEDLFDVARSRADCPPLNLTPLNTVSPKDGSAQQTPKGVVIVTNGGGAGVLCTDHLSDFGVPLATLSPECIAALDASGKMHPAYSRANPLDIVGDALPDRYAAALNTVLAQDNVAGAIVIQTLQTMTDPVEDARVLIDAKKQHPDKPIVAVFMGGKYSEESINLLRENSIPDYNDPKKAARAMAALAGLL
ncbi:Acetate--CoA ligase [ADP-forming] I [uncultured archaeon]|nr:Acetate--CoA ligase [ADP-forming] I [uncultured archaeon]